MTLREGIKAVYSRPPGLRASRGKRSCANCVYFRAKTLRGGGACRLYGSYPVKASQVSDSWREKS